MLEVDVDIELKIYFCLVNFKLVMIFVISEGGLN